jgi:DnaJ-domain-containing protein 1
LRRSAQTTAQQALPPIPQLPLTLSRFSTLSDKSRASLSRLRPAQSAAPHAAPSAGISVDEAWEIFGIKKKRATEEELKKRYTKLASKYHPDRNLDNQSAATEKMVKVNLAYAALKKHCKF